MLLETYRNVDFDRGRPWFVEALWLLFDALLVRSWLPGTRHRNLILRAFGAAIGNGVVLKPRIRIKFPWRLEIGDHSWIGEDVWIDNLAPVLIGSNCCISQGAYICTGSHDWNSPAFDLNVKSVMIHDCAWIAARSVVGPGVSVGQSAVLTLGSVAVHDLLAGGIYQGVPAILVRKRQPGIRGP